MDWLVTFRKDIPPEEMKRILSQEGCTEDDLSAPISLGEDEQVISAKGPSDLPARLRDERRVLKVSPNSSLTLY